MTLPQGWEQVSFDELTPPGAPIIYGILQPGPEITDGVPYVRPTEIRDGIIEVPNVRRTSPAIAERYSRSSLKFSDTILTIVGTIGKVASVPAALDGGNITQSSCRIRADEGLVSSEFFRNYLLSPEAVDQYAAKRLGTAVPRLNIADIRRFKLPLPPLAEQRRIVEKLGSLTAHLSHARAELARVPALAATLRRNVLGDAFHVDARGTINLGEVVEDVRYGTAQKCDYSLGLTPVLRIPNVQRGRIDLTDIKSAKFSDKEIAKLALRYGDILVIRSNGSLDIVGKSAVVEAEAEAMLYAGYLIRLRPSAGRINSHFLQYFLESPQAREVIVSRARSTSGVNNVNAQQLQSLQIPVRDLSEQKEIVAHITGAFARADRLEAEAARARALLDRLEAAILAKAFRGELVPQDPNDEPASALLDRIRAERAAAPKPKRGRARKAVG